jgi:SARP family transcriptional regulator, regulator of embCAB operon
VLVVDGAAADGSPVRFEVLGPLRGWRGDHELDLGPGKQRSVLAVLLLNANKPTSTTTIVDAVWQDDPPENGANVVQKYVAGLRRVLEPGRSPRTPGQMLTRTDAGYVLHVEPGGLDADVFQHRVRAARAAWSDNDAAESLEHLRAALDLWHGPALAGLQGPLFDPARDRLTEARAGALETRAEIELELGRHDRLVPELLQLTIEFPLREQLRYLLILALYRCGRQAEALAAYRQARDFLTEEFGVEPGERLKQLQLSILRADPTLAAPRSPAPQSSPIEGPPRVRDAAPPRSEAGAIGLDADQTSGPAGPNLPPPVTSTPPSAVRSGLVRRNLWLIKLVLIKFLVFVISLGTFGAFSWAFVAYAANRRRSALLAVAAGAYLALACVFWALVDTPPGSTGDDVAAVAFVLSAIGGAVHATLLIPGPRAQTVPKGHGERMPYQAGHDRTIGHESRIDQLHPPTITRPHRPHGQEPAWSAHHRPRATRHSLVSALAIALPLLSIGLLGWAGIVILAVRRRSRMLIAAAAGYFVPVAVFYMAVDAGTGELENAFAVPMLMLAWGGATLHAALLVLVSNHQEAQVEPEAMRRQARREQARALLDHHPEVARELHIGRPDLSTCFDDGGLIDVNAVPAHILAALPGITAQQVARIVADRQAHGGFVTVDDLVTRGLLPAPLVQTLRDVLIVVRRTG